MKEQYLMQAECRNQRSKKIYRKIGTKTSYLGLRNGSVRLASFPGSMSASVNQCLLQRQQWKSSGSSLHGQDHASLDTSTHCLGAEPPISTVFLWTAYLKISVYVIKSLGFSLYRRIAFFLKEGKKGLERGQREGGKEEEREEGSRL